MSFSKKIIYDDDSLYGFMQMVEPRKGGKIYLLDVEADGVDVMLDAEHFEPDTSICLFFPIEGRCSVSIPNQRQPFSIKQGRHAVLSPSVAGTKFIVHRRLRWVALVLSLSFCKKIFNGVSSIPKAYRSIVERRSYESLAMECGQNSTMRRMVEELLNCQYTGVMSKLFFEARLYDLFGQHLSLLQELKDPRDSLFKLGRVQLEKIEAAREQLIQEMQNPPDLQALAASVSMTPKALNYGFKALYGETAFAHLRNLRLEHARQLLVRHDLPIKEIAWRIGYNHVNNFINAFSARYGMAPGRYRASSLSCSMEPNNPVSGPSS
ncbi:MAG: helix-turn-helix transcriptional regulator [Magnetococcales bacterium]|nr:helix-turn-helix transcriptional regulator [Magnetococcales bacterium]